MAKIINLAENDLTVNLEGEDVLRSESVDKIRDVLIKVSKKIEFGNGVLNISIVNNSKIMNLNEFFANKKEPTDVLAFPLDEIDPQTGENILGDIAVSFEIAQNCAKEYDLNWEHEVILYILHGVLHLAGYEDKTEEGSNKMWELQKEILAEVNVEVSASL